jgi:TolA-binding protein
MRTGTARAVPALVAGTILVAAVATVATALVTPGVTVAIAAPRPVEEKKAPAQAGKPGAGERESSGAEKTPIPRSVPELRMPPPPGAAPAPTPGEVYRALLRNHPGGKSPADTMGNGIFSLARQAFYSGRLEEAIARCAEFTKTYTRNLNLNDALEMQLLIRGYRDFDDQPLKAYAGMLALRDAGRSDSASAAGRAALAKWPGARIRHHIHFQLAELARDRGDHATAMTHALAVADPSSKSRLAPAALKLAGDEAIASGQGPDRALRIYQELLERFPESPLAPQVRSQVLEMRKRLQL